MGITIVGLGPGDSRTITRQAWEILMGAENVYLRTKHHPIVAELKDHTTCISFDKNYESGTDFKNIYKEIVDELISMASEAEEKGSEIIYAVPGHPLVGESTVSALRLAGKENGLSIKIIPGMSFIEPTLTALGLDALDGLQIFDALEIAQYTYPPLSSEVPLLLGQVYSRFLASELKLALMNLYPDEHLVFLIHQAGLSYQLVEEIPLYYIDRSANLAHLSSLFVPPMPYGCTLSSLAETVTVLRGPNGCPWDQEQTHQSMRSGFLEEASEVLTALDEDDSNALREELGDVLYHLVMQAQIASESGEFKLVDVLTAIVAKLKHRHPHVWGDIQVKDSEEVIRNWELIKEHERRGERDSISVLDNIPSTLPALASSQKIQERVKRVGFDWPSMTGVETKVEEEISEVKSAKTFREHQYEIGDLLFAIVNWARWLSVDAETALRETNLRFCRRFNLVEKIAIERGLKLSELDIDSLEKIWNEAKHLSKNN